MPPRIDIIRAIAASPDIELSFEGAVGPAAAAALVTPLPDWSPPGAAGCAGR